MLPHNRHEDYISLHPPPQARLHRGLSLNAVTHGLSSRTLVLANEEPAALDHLRALYAHRFPPASPAEADLLEQVVAARWRLRRYWTAETALFDAEMIRQRSRVEHEWPNLDEPLRFALAFEALADDHHSLDTLSRYQARLFREYHIALRAFLDLREKPPSFPLHPIFQNEPESPPKPLRPLHLPPLRTNPNPAPGEPPSFPLKSAF